MKKMRDIIFACMIATAILVTATATMACTDTIVVFDDPTWNAGLYNVEDLTVNAHYWNLGDNEVVELFGNRGNDIRPWNLGTFGRDGNEREGTLTVSTGVGCCNDCGSDTFVLFATTKRNGCSGSEVEYFESMSEFLRNYNIVGITMFQRPCTEPCQEQVTVWFTSPECGDNVGVDTTEISVSWRSRGTEHYTILGLATTNQPWDDGIVYLMDILDGSKLSGSSIFYVGSCKDTEDGNGIGASTEYLELIAVKDGDLEEVRNLDWPVTRTTLDEFVEASDNVWVERPCGGCCGRIEI